MAGSSGLPTQNLKKTPNFDQKNTKIPFFKFENPRKNTEFHSNISHLFYDAVT